MRWIAPFVLCSCLVLVSSTSLAEDRTWAEVAELARAGTEEDIAALRATTSIDGVPARLDRVLGPGAVTEARLRVLSAVSGSAAVDRASVEQAVREILSQPRFASAPPESFWARWQRRAIEWLLGAISWVVAAVGGPLPAALLGLSVVTLVGVLLSLTLGRRRTTDIRRMEEIKRVLAIGQDPADLEQRAIAAAAAADYSTSIRLRFVAGLLRLDRKRLIDFRAALTSGQIGESLGSPVFDQLATDFDEVAYGRHTATATDEARTVSLWKELLE